MGLCGLHVVEGSVKHVLASDFLVCLYWESAQPVEEILGIKKSTKLWQFLDSLSISDNRGLKTEGIIL